MNVCAHVETRFPLGDPVRRICGRPADDDIHDAQSMKFGAHEFQPTILPASTAPERFGMGDADDDRIGDWVCTFTGIRFYPLDPRLSDFNIDDIAHSLSMQCRFNGHSRYFYSVAQHCVHVVDLLERWYVNRAETLLWGLMHDAPEAYCSDVPRPLKRARAMDAYVDIESNIARVMRAWLGLPTTLPLVIHEIVKTADNAMLRNEAVALMPEASVKRWNMPIVHDGDMKIMPMGPRAARDAFLRTYERLRVK